MIAEYSALMPFITNPKVFPQQRGQLFMTLALAGLPSDLEIVCNQILLGPTVPTYDMVQEQFLCLSSLQTFGHSSISTSDSSALVSHSSNRGRQGKGRGDSRGGCL